MLRKDAGPFLEFEVFNNSEVQGQFDKLVPLRLAALTSPLHVGHSFTFVVPQLTVPPAKSGFRPLPAFAHLSGDRLTLRLEKELQGEPDRMSLVWLCTVESSSEPASTKPDRVIAKFIQPSMLVIPNPSKIWMDDYSPPKQLVHLEESAYKKLAPLQGGCIPRFYGKHEVTMPNSEAAVMLVIEYIEGETAAEFRGPVHSTSDGEPILSSEVYHGRLSNIKAAVISAQRALLKIHEHGVLHNDLKPPNIILSWTRGLDGSEPRPSVIFIDFGNSEFLDCPIESELGQVKTETDICDLTKAVGFCCPSHEHDLRQWIDEGGPGNVIAWRDTTLDLAKKNKIVEMWLEEESGSEEDVTEDE